MATPKQVDRFTDIERYLNGVKLGEGKKYRARKALFADRVSQHMTKDHAEPILDLQKRMSEVLKRIESWNK
jgi:hypothetical protein